MDYEPPLIVSMASFSSSSSFTLIDLQYPDEKNPTRTFSSICS